MIMNESYKEDLIEQLREIPAAAFRQRPLDDILADADLLDALWVVYQKDVEEYDCDPDYAARDALMEVCFIDAFAI